MNLADLKRELHCARSALQYQQKTARPERDGARAAQLAAARARVAAAETGYRATLPDPVSISLRSMYFIGPRLPPRRRGQRGDGPTIQCFRCEAVKPRDCFPKKGTVCDACVNLQTKKWAEKNPEKRKESVRAWDRRNKESRRSKWKEDYAANPEKYLLASRQSYQRNKPQKNAWTREYLRRRKKTDPRWRALLTCKRRMWILFKSVGLKKNLRSAELIGTDRAGFYAHIESLWLPGMTWENRGKWGWHIDHKIPCAYFDMTDPVQAKACWNYKNLQPMWWRKNSEKGDRFDPVAAKKYLDEFRSGIIRGLTTVEQSAAAV